MQAFVALSFVDVPRGNTSQQRKYDQMQTFSHNGIDDNNNNGFMT